MAEFKPHGDRVCVKADELGKEINGILIPGLEGEQQDTGTVITVGPMVTETSVDSRVVFSKFAGQKVVIDDQELLVMKENDIIGEVV